VFSEVSLEALHGAPQTHSEEEQAAGARLWQLTLAGARTRFAAPAIRRGGFSLVAYIIR